MRIVVSNPDNLGDFVIRQPMLAALAAAGHELLLIVRTHVAPLAAWAMPGARIVQCVADPYQPGFQLDGAPDDRLIPAVTAFDPEILVVASFQHTQLEEQLAQRFPRAKAIGFGGELFQGELLQRDAPRNLTRVPAINLAVQVQVGREWPEFRKSEALAGAIVGTSVTLAPPRLIAEERFLTIASGRLHRDGFANRKFWIVCAGQGSVYTALKNWNLEKWAAVCSAMVRDHGLHLIFVGTPSEHESTAAIRALMGELAGKTLDMTVHPDGLDMLVGLTALADGYLGKDTGPMHIAAALGKPVVAVFGGGHWPRFLPSSAVGRVLSVNVPCSDCNWICPYKTSYCVKNIPIEAVRDAIDAVVAGRQKEFEVTLLEPEPWVARAMILDATATAGNAMRVLATERAKFNQWQDERLRDIDGLRHALARVESQKSTLAAAASQPSDRQTELADLQRQLLEHQTESVTLRRQNAALQSSLTALSSSAAEQLDCKSGIAALHQQLAVSMAESSALQQQHSALQASLTALSSSSAEQFETLRDALASLRNVLQTNQARDDRLTRFRHRTARRLLDYRSRIAILQQQSATAQRLVHLVPELEALREENSRLGKECNQRAASLDAARGALDQIESRYRGTIADLRQQLHRAEEQLRAVLTLVPELRDELARCLDEVARIPGIEADRADRGRQIDLLHTHIEHQKARIAQLEATLLPRRLINLLKKS
jgi:ADP-heptose:LPS heptosyltransferase/predicted  nucleic acid-binding Zn-ribbon protein